LEIVIPLSRIFIILAGPFDVTPLMEAFLQDFEKKVEIEAAKLRARTKDGDGRDVFCDFHWKKGVKKNPWGKRCFKRAE